MPAAPPDYSLIAAAADYLICHDTPMIAI